MKAVPVFLASALLSVSGLHSSTIFNASGTFADGATLGGTITIDPGTGQVTAAALTVSTLGTFTIVDGVGGSDPPVYFSLGVEFPPGPLPDLSISIPGTNFVGYTGGPICSNTQPCTAPGINVGSGIWITDNQSDSLTVGSLSTSTPSPGVNSSVPEPASIFLVSVCVLLALGFRKGRLASQ